MIDTAQEDAIQFQESDSDDSVNLQPRKKKTQRLLVTPEENDDNKLIPVSTRLAPKEDDIMPTGIIATIFEKMFTLEDPSVTEDFSNEPFSNEPFSNEFV